MRILIYGYGNPGRADDGLGIQLAERLGVWAHDHMPGEVLTDSNYQLNVEDAELISSFDLVLFADASREELQDFCITPVHPSPEASFTTHAASAEFLLHLCDKLFQTCPPTYMVHIKGYDWEFREGLSKEAKNNLTLAMDHLKENLPLLSKRKDTDIIVKECKSKTI